MAGIQDDNVFFDNHGRNYRGAINHVFGLYKTKRQEKANFKYCDKKIRKQRIMCVI
jgi:hypothetical protein